MKFNFFKKENKTAIGSILYDLFFTTQYLERLEHSFDIHSLLNNRVRFVHSLNSAAPSIQYLPYLSASIKELHNVSDLESISSDDMLFEWGHTCRGKNTIEKLFYLSTTYRKPIYLIEDGFLKSVCTWTDNKADRKDKAGVSFTIDDLSYYFDGTKQTRLEQMLNSDESLSNEEIIRTRNVIKMIRTQYLSKYNHQPIYIPKELTSNKKKVLIVDQSYGDFSILRGQGSPTSFSRMLSDAIKNHPDSQIFIKIHPDTIARGKSSGYFSIEDSDRAMILSKNINPLVLLEQMDVVYVCTSQLGFEALMCNKEVHVYGMPFYAGWGLTKDQLKNPRRNKNRSLEELFYFTYIKYSSYINPDKKAPCEIEEAIEILSRQRNNFFKRNNILFDKTLLS